MGRMGKGRSKIMEIEDGKGESKLMIKIWIDGKGKQRMGKGNQI